MVSFWTPLLFHIANINISPQLSGAFVQHRGDQWTTELSKLQTAERSEISALSESL